VGAGGWAHLQLEDHAMYCKVPDSRADLYKSEEEPNEPNICQPLGESEDKAALCLSDWKNEDLGSDGLDGEVREGETSDDE